tara:strand:+ start:72 stop:281 length:210 start_codon:yes stop_codon:yes gene_type:complete
MTNKQKRILETLIYFLEKYKKSAMKSENSTGFEEMVFEQMIDTVNELVEENRRLSELNKPKIIKGEDSE